MLHHLTRHLFYEKVNGKIYKAGGAKAFKIKHLDPWHKSYGMLGGIFDKPYQPKPGDVDLNTIDIKDQNGYNTCTWDAYTIMRQVSEKVKLSVRSIVAYAKTRGYLSGNGYSDLSFNSKAGAEFGIAEENVCNPDLCGGNFDAYSAPSILTQAVRDNASTHKPDFTKRFWCKSKDEFIKALDDGYAIEIGMDWYSGYNQNGGLKAPWIIKLHDGVKVGGHGITIRGRKQLTMLNGVINDALLKIQNSYSEFWGDKGCFYMKLSDLVKDGIAGLVEVDMTDANWARVVSSYEGKQVKGTGSSIYLIRNGAKCSFVNPETFFIFGGRYGKYGNTFVNISQSILDKIPTGEDLTAFDSPYWPELQKNGLTVDFVLKNQAMMGVWLDNPQTLKLIVDTFNKIAQYRQGQETQNIWDKFKSFFNK